MYIDILDILKPLVITQYRDNTVSHYILAQITSMISLYNLQRNILYRYMCQCTIYHLQFTVCPAQCTMYSVRCSVMCKVYSVEYIV